MKYLIFFCLSAFTFLSSCQSKQSKLSPEESSGAPSYGDMYVAASIGDASFLNPILASDSASGDVNGLVYNGLVKYDKDIKLIGDLAERWSISKDGLVLTFYLRKNVKWHDGKPFTAEDVKFTYERLIDPKVLTPYSADYLLVKKFEILNPYTIRITYKEPLASSLESWGIGIIPKHIFANGDFNSNPANRNPVWNRPF